MKLVGRLIWKIETVEEFGIHPNSHKKMNNSREKKQGEYLVIISLKSKTNFIPSTIFPIYIRLNLVESIEMD